MQLHHVSNQSVRVKDINNQLLPPTHPPTRDFNTMASGQTILIPLPNTRL